MAPNGTFTTGELVELRTEAVFCGYTPSGDLDLVVHGQRVVVPPGTVDHLTPAAPLEVGGRVAVHTRYGARVGRLAELRGQRAVVDLGAGELYAVSAADVEPMPAESQP